MRLSFAVQRSLPCELYCAKVIPYLWFKGRSTMSVSCGFGLYWLRAAGAGDPVRARGGQEGVPRAPRARPEGGRGE